MDEVYLTLQDISMAQVQEMVVSFTAGQSAACRAKRKNGKCCDTLHVPIYFA
jgi:hypothetical protein